MNFPKGKFIDTIYMIADVKSITFAGKKLKIFLKKVEKKCRESNANFTDDL